MILGIAALCCFLSSCLAVAKLPSIWEVGVNLGHVEVRHDIPDPKELFDVYVKGLRAHPDEEDGKWKHPHGRVVLLKDAAKKMPAFSRWATDELLIETYGKERLDQVETEKSETRTKYPYDDWSLKKFLHNYNTSNIYCTATAPTGMQDDIYLLPSFNCGGYQRKIKANVLWMSSGGTQSVIHNDGGLNQHCIFAGRKRWILWHPTQDRRSKDLGFVNADEEAEHDPAFKDAYGAYYGKVDYTAVDLEKYPGWKKMQFYTMDMEAGDCALIPHRWLHHVEAPRDIRTISVHVWLDTPKKFSEQGCELLKSKGVNVSDFLFPFSRCTWGYGESAEKTKCTLKLPKKLPKEEM